MEAGDYLRSAVQTQAQINQIALGRYLDRLAIAVADIAEGVVYVDAFSGPWNAAAESLDTTAPATALRQLRKARESIQRTHGRHLRLNAIFLEKDVELAKDLTSFTTAQSDIESRVLNASLEQSIPALVDALKTAGPTFVPLFFLGPIDWSALSLATLAPLLCLEPAVFLINVMTESLVRHAADPENGMGTAFEGLLGDSSFRGRARNLKGRAKEDALVFEYARRVRETGRYPYSAIACVPDVAEQCSYTHLICATRHPALLDAFKEAENRASKTAAQARADAKRRNRELRTNQTELLTGRDMPETDYVRELEAHYAGLAKKTIYELLLTKRDLSFDTICAAALQFPTVGMPAVRKWILEIADFDNLGTGDRVAKLGCGHRVKLRDGKGQTAELDFNG